MQERLVRAERLAVLGELAGSVGHELRNPLGAISNAVYFLNMVLEDPEPEVKETLEIVGREVARSERIVGSLLSFARPKPPVRRKVVVDDVIQSVLSRMEVPDGVELAHVGAEELPPILADPDQPDQVFSNLILNGTQAMPEGGQLTIGARAEEEWVEVSAVDTGVGIARENLGRIFEPLYSTKAKGIGLGLAIVDKLVQGHGGTIVVESEVGAGTTFEVRLPVMSVKAGSSE
jgi:signal transduction histidine kinase